MFGSNFLNTNIFDFGNNAFAVWFVLLLLCFACGWYMDRTLNWNLGGKVVFATIVAATFISLVVVVTFREYFFGNQTVVEDLVMYTLRNITLGSISFFGLAVAEILMLEKNYAIVSEKLKLFETVLHDSGKEAELKIKEAELNAGKIVQEAEMEAKEVLMKKERIQKELKDFIQIEKELIRKYENL
ncbi:MAG: hypothetical protein CO128_01495 [Ignavibacteriales bacterium CG_4_9_14_3_um_filter_30_11]|nr:MAG: hypothetical protein CO128_01495 [Ignavibacteriales bacterium CG_4_9_14_3_um_filter_30_11]